MTTLELDEHHPRPAPAPRPHEAPDTRRPDIDLIQLQWAVTDAGMRWHQP